MHIHNDRKQFKVTGEKCKNDKKTAHPFKIVSA